MFRAKSITDGLLAFTLAAVPITVLVSGLAAAPLAVGLVILLLLRHRRQVGSLRSIGLFPWVFSALIIALPLASVLWSPVAPTSLSTILRTMALLLLIPAILLLRRPLASYRAALWAAPAAGIAVACLLILYEFIPFGGPLRWWLEWRGTDYALFMGRYINRGACALAVLVWPAALALLAAGYQRLAMALPLPLLACLLGLESLAAQMAWLTGMLAFWGMLLAPGLLRPLLKWGIPVFFLIWPALFWLAEPAIREHVYHHLPESSQHRIEIWHFVLEKWQERPLLGWGADASRAIPGGDAEVRPRMALLPLHPHNLVFNVLLELGIAGLLLFTAALALLLRRCFSPVAGPAVQAVTAATIVAYLTIGWSAFGLWQAWWIAVALLSLLLIEGARAAVRGNIPSPPVGEGCFS